MTSPKLQTIAIPDGIHKHICYQSTEARGPPEQIAILSLLHG